MGFVHVHLIPYVHDLGFAQFTNASAQFLLALVLQNRKVLFASRHQIPQELLNSL